MIPDGSFTVVLFLCYKTRSLFYHWYQLKQLNQQSVYGLFAETHKMRLNELQQTAIESIFPEIVCYFLQKSNVAIWCKMAGLDYKFIATGNFCRKCVNFCSFCCRPYSAPLTHSRWTGAVFKVLSNYTRTLILNGNSQPY